MKFCRDTTTATVAGENGKVLIVSEHLSNCTDIMEMFVSLNMPTHSSRTATDGIHWLMNNACSLVILDLPVLNDTAFQLIQIVRRLKDMGIMVVLSQETTENKTATYEMGADDFAERPLVLDDFMLRIKSLIRRFEAYCSATEKKYRHKILIFPELIIDPIARRIHCDGEDILLPRREFDLLYILAAHPKQVMTYELLYYHVWNQELIGNDTTSVRQSVSHIRRTLPRSEYIATIRGIGYRFDGEQKIA